MNCSPPYVTVRSPLHALRLAAPATEARCWFGLPLKTCTLVPRRACYQRFRSLLRAAADDISSKSLVVVGSVNADLVLELDRLPLAGETLAASTLQTFPGGKGANQAAAAARLQCPTYFVGQVGDDANAALLQSALSDSGVDTRFLRQVDGPTGTAVILLQPSGENSIIIVGGANTAAWDFSAEVNEALGCAGAVLLQREVPKSVNLHAAQVARRGGVMVVLDCGGAEAPLSNDLLRCVTLLSPNETELARLTGLPTSNEGQIEAAARALMERGVEQVLVKLGAQGSLLLQRGSGEAVRQPAVAADKVVDTTGAGDCFTAAYAVAVLEGAAPSEALEFAAAAASICVSRQGAMPSLPHRAELDALLQHIR